MQIANNVYATDDIDSNPPIVYKTRILWLLLFGSMKRENSWRRISSSVLYDLSANCMRCINVCTRTCASISGTVVPCSMQSCCCFVLFAVMQHTMRHLIGMRKLSALSFWCVCCDNDDHNRTLYFSADACIILNIYVIIIPNEEVSAGAINQEDVLQRIVQKSKNIEKFTTNISIPQRLVMHTAVFFFRKQNSCDQREVHNKWFQLIRERERSQTRECDLYAELNKQGTH